MKYLLKIVINTLESQHHVCDSNKKVEDLFAKFDELKNKDKSKLAIH